MVTADQFWGSCGCADFMRASWSACGGSTCNKMSKVVNMSQGRHRLACWCR